MDVITLGMQALEATIHTGSAMVDSLNHLAQVAQPDDGSEVTCEYCRCTW